MSFYDYDFNTHWFLFVDADTNTRRSYQREENDRMSTVQPVHEMSLSNKFSSALKDYEGETSTVAQQHNGIQILLDIRGIESSFTTITTCFPGLPLLKGILLLPSNSEGTNYFPWDASALSLSIFVFSSHHCFTVHFFVRSVPFVGDFLCKGRLKSISFTCEDGSLCKIYHQRPPRQENLHTAARGMQNIKSRQKTKTPVVYEDSCKQIHTCSCSKSDLDTLLMKGHGWIHRKLGTNATKKWQKDCCPVLLDHLLRTLFLLYLLFLSLIPTVAAQTSNTSGELHSTAFPSSILKSPSRLKLFCDQYPRLENYLSGKEVKDCFLNDCDPNDGYHCCKGIKMVVERDKQAETDVKDFLNTMAKYATSRTFSVQWSMDCCKTAYKNWVCSHYHRYYEDGVNNTKLQKDACPSICDRVEKSCPFFRVHNDTKLYGGQPTFLCRGFQAADSTSSLDCHDMNNSACGSVYRFDNQDRRDKFWTLSESIAMSSSRNSSNLASSASNYSVVWLNLVLCVLVHHLLCR